MQLKELDAPADEAFELRASTIGVVIGELHVNTANTSNSGTGCHSAHQGNIAPPPHPLPMPEYGGYFAPLTEFLPDIGLPISGFHRCNVAVMLLVDIVVEGIDGIDLALNIPLMLHILFLGLDHTRPIVRDHCKRLLLNLLVVLAEHNDHLTVARILLNSQTHRLGLGLSIPPLAVLAHNFTEPDDEFDCYLYDQAPLSKSATVVGANNNAMGGNPPATVVAMATSAAPPSASMSASAEHQQYMAKSNDSNTSADTTMAASSSASTADTKTNAFATTSTTSRCEVSLTITDDHNTMPLPGPAMPIAQVVKSLIQFLSQESAQPLWNYEDITAKVWTIKSAEQIACFLRHILKVYTDSYTQARIAERWAQTALQLGLSCSSRHYAGRSLQVFRALNVPINSRMLSDILSRLVETVAEQGEDMQGYVTELLLTLEAAADSLESDFRPLDVMKDIFKSTPNLNNKDGGGGHIGMGVVGMMGAKKSPSNIAPLHVASHMQTSGHTRSTSYSVSYCTRKISSSPIEKQGLCADALTRSYGLGIYDYFRTPSRTAQPRHRPRNGAQHIQVWPVGVVTLALRPEPQAAQRHIDAGRQNDNTGAAVLAGRVAAGERLRARVSARLSAAVARPASAAARSAGRTRQGRKAAAANQMDRLPWRARALAERLHVRDHVRADHHVAVAAGAAAEVSESTSSGV